jgi:hypothetical protein
LLAKPFHMSNPASTPEPIDAEFETWTEVQGEKQKTAMDVKTPPTQQNTAPTASSTVTATPSNATTPTNAATPPNMTSEKDKKILEFVTNEKLSTCCGNEDTTLKRLFELCVWMLKLQKLMHPDNNFNLKFDSIIQNIDQLRQNMRTYDRDDYNFMYGVVYGKVQKIILEFSNK